ncbi:MAG TPA: N-acetyltransferase [Candidatus Limnocylindria bacterium]
MSQLRIRPERPGDADAIRRVHDAAFGGLIEGRIVDESRHTGWWLPWGSLVAVDAPASRIVGHLLMSRATLEGTADEPWPILVIGPVGVRPEEQGRGVGAALMRAAIAAAGDRDESLICLVGHAGYYPRFGFEPARGIGIQPPHPWPDENWLALRLPAWTPDLRGTARFPPAFPDG